MKTLLVTNNIKESRNFICEQIQQAWQAYLIKKTDKEKKQKKENVKSQDFHQSNKDFKIIVSKQQYEELKQDEKFVPDVVFIIPELMWEHDGVNEGYSIARELITHTYKSKFIQVVFLSVLERSTLSRSVDTRNRGFVEAFPHVCLLDNEPEIRFEYYSNIHFNLIKHLAISDHGRLQKISHEMNSVNANILNEKLEIQQNKTQLIKELEELSLFQSWIPTVTNIQELIAVVNNATQKSELVKIGKEISSIISDISLKLPKGISENTPEKKYKKDYKVLVIEDEKVYREYFLKVLSNFYNDVYPNENNKYSSENGLKDFDIRDAKEIIAINAKKYQIFLLDLLYKDKDGNWLNFNGLDLFKLIIEKNRYAVIRIITSLPRGIVAKVVETIFNNTSKPNTDQVFTKKYGYEALKDSIVDSIDNINMECEKNEQEMKLLWPIPKNGIFKKPSISQLMISLLTDRKTEYEDNLSKAFKFYELFSKNQLTKDTKEWNGGKLGKGDSFSNPSNKFFLEKLPYIIFYRLIAIEASLESDMQRVNFEAFLEKISECSNIQGIDNPFFYSIGFSKGKEEKNEGYYQMSFSYFLPHESQFIEQKTREKYEDSFVETYPNLCQWVQTNLLNNKYLDSVWKNLKLNFDWYKKNFEIKTLTISQLQVFFSNLYSLSTERILNKVFIQLQNASLTKDVETELKEFPELIYQIELVLNKD